MFRKYVVVSIFLCFFSGTIFGLAPIVSYAASAVEMDSHGDEFSEYDDVDVIINDPLEVMNRGVFIFNDSLRRWFMEPAARGYREVTPSMFRTGMLNFFRNLLEPTRIVNCLLQGRFRAAEETFLRFVLNTTVGVGGLMDPATVDGMNSHERQFNSTLAEYGVNTGPYLVLPFFGPGSFRGTAGLAVDTLTSPLLYVLDGELLAAFIVKSSDAINQASFKLGEYEKMISGSLDPYVAVRDAYIQYQQKWLEDESDMMRGTNPCVLE